VRSIDEQLEDRANGATYEVGYCRPPVHARFKAGQSGNPSGRPKGSPNLKTVFEQILKETISLREGNVTKKITKAEAIMRSLVISAMKGDSKSQLTLFKLAEQTGQFVETAPPFHIIERVIVDPPGRSREAGYLGNGEVDST
jgi:hypothetical protein